MRAFSGPLTVVVVRPVAGGPRHRQRRDAKPTQAGALSAAGVGGRSRGCLQGQEAQTSWLRSGPRRRVQAALIEALDRVRQARDALAAAELDLWNEIDAQLTDRHAALEAVAKALVTGKQRLVDYRPDAALD